MLFLDVKVCCPEAQPRDVCAACPSLVPSRVSQEASQLPVLFSAASAAGSALLLSEQQLEPLSIKLSTSWYARIKLGLPLYGMSATQLLRSSCPIAGVGLKHLTAGWGKAAEARRGTTSPRSAIPTHLPPALLWGCSADTALGPGPPLRVLQEPRAANGSSGVTLEEFSLSP